MNLLIHETIGLYGVSGIGKSFQLEKIRQAHPEWSLVEGSEDAIIEVCGGDLAIFKMMSGEEKNTVRSSAIKTIKWKPGITVVTGHYGFPGTSEGAFAKAFTVKESNSYTAIFYLEKNPEKVHENRGLDNDTGKHLRPDYEVSLLRHWIEWEKKELETECRLYGIPFSVISLEESASDVTCSQCIEFYLMQPFERAKKVSEEALLSIVR